MNWLPRILAWMMRASILLLSFYYLVEGDLFASMLYVIAFLMSLLPLVVNAVYDVRLHWIFDLTFSFWLLWHMIGFLGAYDAIGWWDDLGHIYGGAILALIGFAWLYSMNAAGKMKLTLPMIGLFSVMWTTTAGVVWEVWEFLWDSAHGLVNVYGMAQNGLIDTMTDLSFDIIAGICMVLICVYLVRHTHLKTKDRIINPFISIIEKRN